MAFQVVVFGRCASSRCRGLHPVCHAVPAPDCNFCTADKDSGPGGSMVHPDCIRGQLFLIGLSYVTPLGSARRPFHCGLCAGSAGRWHYAHAGSDRRRHDRHHSRREPRRLGPDARSCSGRAAIAERSGSRPPNAAERARRLCRTGLRRVLHALQSVLRHRPGRDRLRELHVELRQGHLRCFRATAHGEQRRHRIGHERFGPLSSS